MIGEAEWALDPEAIEAVRLLDGYKAYSGNVEGVVVDIEPYLLSAFTKELPADQFTKLHRRPGFRARICTCTSL